LGEGCCWTLEAMEADALVISVPFFPFPSQHHPSTDLAAAFFLLRRNRLMTNNPSLGN
jgi:hypothetical protein